VGVVTVGVVGCGEVVLVGGADEDGGVEEGPVAALESPLHAASNGTQSSVIAPPRTRRRISSSCFLGPRK
jgi:hypothetical protein